MITYSSQQTSVSYAGCVGAHFGLHQLTTYIDKKHKQIKDKRRDAASDHAKNQCSSDENSHMGGLAGESYFQEDAYALARNKFSAIQAPSAM